MLKRAVVVGGSSGIGAALVRRLAREGYKVAAVARRQEILDDLCDEVNRDVESRRAWGFVHDVTDTEGAQACFDEICTTLDGLDLIVYTAGVMPIIDEDTYDSTLDRRTIEVNLIGAITWLNLAAERFKLQESGTIVGVGSVAGDRGRVGQPAYAASKAGLHTYMEALRNRLSKHGVTVITIKPGPTRTPMTREVDKMPLAIDASDSADGIFNAIARRSTTTYVPFVWWPIMTAIQAIPSVIFRRMGI